MLIFAGAHDQRFGMGFKGRLPWPRMGADIERFHKLTKDKTVLMGERTYQEYQSVKHAYGVGKIYVLSSSHEQLPDAEVINNLEDIKEKSKSEDIWVIGGGSVFKQLIDFADRMYLTRIEGEFEVDTYFPEYNLHEWNVSQESFKFDSSNPYPYVFLELSRK